MYFRYVVKYYNECDIEEQQESGIVHGKEYGSAANKVVERYGKSCVADIYLKEIGDSINCLNDDEIEYAINGH